MVVMTVEVSKVSVVVLFALASVPVAAVLVVQIVYYCAIDIYTLPVEYICPYFFI